MTATDMVSDVPKLDTTDKVYISPAAGDITKVGLVGLIVGLLVPLLGWLLGKYLVGPVFCHTSTAGLCVTPANTGYYLASILVGVGAIVVLANMGIFRPLLIPVASLITLWGLQKYIMGLMSGSGIEYYLYSGLLYVVSYMLFYWLLRLNNFLISFVLVIIAIIGLRWALIY